MTPHPHENESAVQSTGNESGSVDGVSAPIEEALSFSPHGSGALERADGSAPLITLRIPLPPHALPEQPTPLIGRETLVERLEGYLDEPGTRLLTLIGPGGVGKTRLACAVARARESDAQFVGFVDLAPLRDSSRVTALVLEAIAAVRLASIRSLEQRPDELDDQQTLLVLDNVEHVIEAAPQVAQLLAERPWLQVIATSRSPLRVRWEHICLVPALELPPLDALPAPSLLAAIPSVALFTMFVRRLLPDFTLSAENARVVSEICHRVEGLPLALELAAADLRMMPLERLLSRLDRPLDTLIRGPRDLPYRQQAMRASIEWSYGLLAPEEQAVARSLAIFAGGGTLSAVEEVLRLPPAPAYDILINLAEQNLLQVVESSQAEPRFRMQPMVREYLYERLAVDNEQVTIQDRFIACVLRFAESAVAQFGSSDEEPALHALRSELDNVRAVFRLAAGPQHVEHGLRMALTLAPFWVIPGQLAEGRKWLEVLVARSTAGAHAELRTEALLVAARLAVWAGDALDAQQLLDAATIECQAIANLSLRSSIATQRCAVRLMAGDVSGAEEILECAPELQELDLDIPHLAEVILLRGIIAAERGQDDDARQLLNDAQSMFAALDNQRHALEAELAWAELALVNGDRAGAALRYASILRRAEVAGDPRLRARALIGLGDIDGDRQAINDALLHYHDAFGIAEQHGDGFALVQIVERMAVLGVTSQSLPCLLRLAGLADAIRERSGLCRTAADRRRLEPKLRLARELLGDDEYARLHAEGRTLSIESVGADLDSAASRRLRAPLAVPASGTDADAAPVPLTRREREVVQQISKGHTNRQIATNLGIAERTVDSHVGNILQKLQLTSRARIAVWAVGQGLSSPD